MRSTKPRQAAAVETGTTGSSSGNRNNGQQQWKQEQRAATMATTAAAKRIVNKWTVTIVTGYCLSSGAEWIGYSKSSGQFVDWIVRFFPKKSYKLNLV